MGVICVAFLGDIFGTPGRLSVKQQLPTLRQEHQPDIVIANAENARSGSGLSPDLYRKIRDYGVDAVTLGDHAFREKSVISILETPGEPIARPANLSAKAPGRSFVRLAPGGNREKPLYVITVLGRIFMGLPADDPFAAVDRFLDELADKSAVVIVEAHMEATSEKAALAHYLDGRVAMVVGTHTHVPTADARVLPRKTGFITDVGMCGPTHSIIGRDAENVLRHMTTSQHAPYAVGSGGEAMCGVIARIDEATARTLSIQRVQYDANITQPPFVGMV